jgi:hypothetical protein
MHMHKHRNRLNPAAKSWLRCVPRWRLSSVERVTTIALEITTATVMVGGRGRGRGNSGRGDGGRAQGGREGSDRGNGGRGRGGGRSIADAGQAAEPTEAVRLNSSRCMPAMLSSAPPINRRRSATAWHDSRTTACHGR